MTPLVRGGNRKRESKDAHFRCEAARADDAGKPR